MNKFQIYILILSCMYNILYIYYVQDIIKKDYIKYVFNINILISVIFIKIVYISFYIFANFSLIETQL